MKTKWCDIFTLKSSTSYPSNAANFFEGYDTDVSQLSNIQEKNKVT